MPIEYPTTSGLRGPASRRPTLLVALALAALVLVVFSPVFRAEFLNYDDDTHVVRNTHVASGISGENFTWALTTTHMANWMPLTWISHQLTVQLFGMRPGPPPPGPVLDPAPSQAAAQSAPEAPTVDARGVPPEVLAAVEQGDVARLTGILRA